jgi:hypothetical protein
MAMHRVKTLTLLIVVTLTGCGDSGSNGGDRPDADISNNNSIPVQHPACDEAAPALPTPLLAYYFAADGEDANDGLSEAAPKQDIAQIAGMATGAAPGTHFLLRRGDTFRPTAGITLSEVHGTEADPIVIGAYGDGDQPTIAGDHTDGIITVRGGADQGTFHVRIDDIRFTAANPPGNRPGPLYVNESWHPNPPHHITFSRITVDGLPGGMVLYQSDITVTHSLIRNNYNVESAGEGGHSQGIYLSGERMTIRYTAFDNNGKDDSWFDHHLYLSHGDSYDVHCNTFYNGNSGIKLRGGHNTVVERNELFDLGSAMILGGDDQGGLQNAVVRNNLVYRVNQAFDIKSQSGDGVGVIENVIVAQNIIFDTGIVNYITGVPSLIAVESSQTAQDIYILGNLIYNSHKVNIRIDNDGSNFVVANNIFSRFDNEEVVVYNVAVTDETNLIFTTEAAFLADLMPADPAAGDFRPTAPTATCVDTGTDYSAFVPLDYDGNPRPEGAGYDIGPFEQ